MLKSITLSALLALAPFAVADSSEMETKVQKVGLGTLSEVCGSSRSTCMVLDTAENTCHILVHTRTSRSTIDMHRKQCENLSERKFQTLAANYAYNDR